MTKIEEILQSFKDDVDKHGRPNEFGTKLKKLVSAVAMQSNNSEWISIDDEKPDNGVLVMCNIINTIGEIDVEKMVLRRNDDEWELIIGNKALGNLKSDIATVTHWQHLPSDPI